MLLKLMVATSYLHSTHLGNLLWNIQANLREAFEEIYYLLSIYHQSPRSMFTIISIGKNFNITILISYFLRQHHIGLEN